MTPEQLATAVAEYAAGPKAQDVLALDLRAIAGFADFFVICSGRSDRQVKAIHDAVHQGLKRDHGLLPHSVEGVSDRRWILIDYLDVIVHVFTPEMREYYRLEQLWGEAPVLALSAA